MSNVGKAVQAPYIRYRDEDRGDVLVVVVHIRDGDTVVDYKPNEKIGAELAQRLNEQAARTVRVQKTA